jgi:hypothetical protein
VTSVSSPHQPLLREFIHIPERTSDSDFVLKLTEGVDDVEATLRDYVITDRLVSNFDQALGLISSAVGGGGSKAAYLHGSFGSGKSHFMAVLHALLRGESAARARDELAGVLAKHDVWIAGKHFLLVPYYMLGAKSLEQRVLGGYSEYVRRLHPGAPIPAVHRTDALLANARHLRAEMGDPAFIRGLPAEEGDDEWGESEPFWTPDRLDAAFAAGLGDPLRRRLVSDVLQSWLPAVYSDALEDAEGFVSLDAGLTEIAGHAKDLGYDGLVLFLDELILWLANSMGNQAFVSREVQKITNFVEGGDARRPIPIVSFIARQRDLRELVGVGVAGAEDLSFQDTLNLASGRFDVITLRDSNLPLIAHRRLLTPMSDEAAKAIDSAFDSTTRVRREVWDTLLGSEGMTGADIESFKLSYPFSPAFTDTLVHVSSALQRERTALKLMSKLLVDHRDDLRLGQLVPLGDLYEVISRGGDQPFTEKLKAEYEAAQRLYGDKLRPYLLSRYNLTDEDVAAVRRAGESLGRSVDPGLTGRVRAFTGDNRLMMTLLLSALAPSVPALRNLTVRRLSALNHGSITSPIPGAEVSQVSRKVSEWAGEFGEIKVTDADDPGVSLELVGVDVQGILNSAGHYDQIGARRNLVKRLVWEELGVAQTDAFVDHADLTWRGSRRMVEVLFGNVRDSAELPDSSFHPLDPTSWRLVVDYPFDVEATYTPAYARSRVAALVGSGEPIRTVCWVPAALTAGRLGDLGRLVVIDTLLSGQRFDSHAQHLNASDRQRARATLTSRRDALLNKVRGVLREAYGLASKQSDDVNPSFDDHLLSLWPSLHPTLPMGASMRDALRRVAAEMLAEQFPAHPDFDPDRTERHVTTAEVRTVAGYVRQAVGTANGRVEVVKADRSVVRRIANPLRLGEMAESAFNLGRHWVEHFDRAAGRARMVARDLAVTDLYRWLDDPAAMGLDKIVANLVVCTFADQTDRVWVRHGGVLDPPPEVTGVTGDMALRQQPLPGVEEWRVASERAAKILGVLAPTLLRGRLVSAFAREVREKAVVGATNTYALVAALERHSRRLGLDPEATGGRLATARRAADLLATLVSPLPANQVVAALATADLGGPPDRTGRSVRSAKQVAEALGAAPWDLFDTAAGLPDPYEVEAREIMGTLARVARNDELTESLPAALDATRAAANLLVRKATRKQAAPQPPQPTQPRPVPGERIWKVTSAADLDGVVAQLKDAAAGRAGTIEIVWRPSR